GLEFQIASKSPRLLELRLGRALPSNATRPGVEIASGGPNWPSGPASLANTWVPSPGYEDLVLAQITWRPARPTAATEGCAAWSSTTSGAAHPPPPRRTAASARHTPASLSVSQKPTTTLPLPATSSDIGPTPRVSGLGGLTCEGARGGIGC